MTQQRLDHCQWCGLPATCDIVVIHGEARVTTRGTVVNTLERRLPACDDCRRRIGAHHTENVIAAYDRAQQIAQVEQCQLF